MRQGLIAVTASIAAIVHHLPLDGQPIGEAPAVADAPPGASGQEQQEKTMNRIPYPDPENLSAAKRAYLENPDLRVLNIARISMVAPDPIWRATVDMAIAVVTDTLTDDRLREVIVLRVANLSGSRYELHHHLSLARSLGFSEAELDALASGDFAALSPRDRLVAQFTTEVVRDVDPSDETVATMRAEFTDEHIFEMMAIIGSYMNAARIAALARIENDDVAIRSWTEERERK